MDDETIKESAKAIQEAAKTSRALIKPGTELAHYVASVLGTVPQDVVGLLIGDPLRELRQHGLKNILTDVFSILKRRGVETMKPLRPSVALPAFEAASVETDETLQEMWATLLANAMDPNNEISLRLEFIETLKVLHPRDAWALDWLNRHHWNTMADVSSSAFGARILVEASEFAISAPQSEMIINRLEQLKALRDQGNQTFLITGLGRELWLACQPGATD